MSSLKSDRAIAGFAFLLLAAFPLLACGPNFPNRVLIGGGNAILDAPVANFQFEIQRLQRKSGAGLMALPPKEADSEFYDRGQSQTEQAAIADFEAALRAAKISGARREDLTRDYGRVRAAFRRFNHDLSEARLGRGDARKVEPPRFDPPSLPDGLPKEFDLYLRGAIHYYSGELARAVSVWESLLALPMDERTYRSTWAAFMLGKALDDEAPDQAAGWFQKVRAFASEGYHDSLGLAASSFGWEALLRLRQKNFGEAVELYFQQSETGDPGALLSLRVACNQAFEAGGDTLEHAARKPLARKVLTAFVVSRGDLYHPVPDSGLVMQWLQAIERAEVFDAGECDRLAWAAYQGGDAELAARWLRLADPKSDMSRWLAVKLLLREGKIAEAAHALSDLSRRFAPFYLRDGNAEAPAVPVALREEESSWFHADAASSQLYGELGVLRMSLREYTESLGALLAGGQWADAAYVAEAVLSPDELKQYVDRDWPLRDKDEEPEAMRAVGGKLRYLLARRLVRVGRWKESRPYFPEELRGVLDEYISAIRGGHDDALSPVERAKRFWKAARLARHSGMELLGTEEAPDWKMHEGNFETMPAAACRAAELAGSALYKGSADELKRAADSRAATEKRFHYRYIAAEHAWSAANLLPDNSEQTAQILCAAGGWLAARDPEAADRFYKALVHRCGKTQLGKDAASLHWFPDVSIPEATIFE